MQDILGGVKYNKSFTITNMQLIITEIGFYVSYRNIWSNMVIHTCVRKPSGRIFYRCSTKGEVGRGLIAMMGKLGTLLCGMYIYIWQSWHFICCRGHWFGAADHWWCCCHCSLWLRVCGQEEPPLAPWKDWSLDWGKLLRGCRQPPLLPLPWWAIKPLPLDLKKPRWAA